MDVAGAMQTERVRQPERLAQESREEENCTLGDASGNRQAEVILRWHCATNEIIRFCSFVDDERPHYIFVLLENEQTRVQYLKLVKI